MNRISQTDHQRSSLRSPIFTLFALMLITGLFFATVQPAGASTNPTPPPGPGWPPLGGIFKTASKQMLGSGETMTYTIHLEASSNATLLADVTDPVPGELDYVDGSVSHSGAYDSTTRTVSWSKVAVTMGAPVNLTFDVKDPAAVTKQTPVVNTATIAMGGLTLQRQAWVLLMPPAPVGSKLDGSFKSAEPRMLGGGGTVTYTIHLLNSGLTSATVQVVDPVPAILTYVPDSASNGGTYDSATQKITWKDVVVPPAISATPVAPVTLTFTAKAPDVFPDSTHPLVVTNTASITSDTITLKRSADILLVTQPVSPLEGSFKAASQKAVVPGQKFTYTINLHNSSNSPVPATVSDKLPKEVSYVDGSANAGGKYDPIAGTLTWTDLSVLDGSPLVLTFDVTAESVIATAAPIRITNTAAITSGTVTLQRSATVWLVGQPGGDNIPPVVQSLIIGGQDVYTSPDVTLHIKATDNVKVATMDLKEWVLTGAPFPHWQEVKNSGWVPYQEDYAWTFDKQSGTHFIGVWVADAALNRSKLTRSAVDFASLLLPATHVSQGGMLPYLVYYPAGVQVTAALNVTSGEAYLFVWHPGNMFGPDDISPTPGSTSQTITFTTKTAGVYMFLVHAKQASVFDLGITPAGGPAPVALSAAGSTAGIAMDSALSSTTVLTDTLTYNPILPQSGLDPLSTALDPVGPFVPAYLPMIMR